jgi:hypothetical protein
MTRGQRRRRRRGEVKRRISQALLFFCQGNILAARCINIASTSGMTGCAVNSDRRGLLNCVHEA